MAVESKLVYVQRGFNSLYLNIGALEEKARRVASKNPFHRKNSPTWRIDDSSFLNNDKDYEYCEIRSLEL